MAWFSGRVNLGNFPDLAGAVNKISESVKNIEKNFDNALGLEEKPESSDEDLLTPQCCLSRWWRGFNYKFKPTDRIQIQRKQHDKERTLEEHRKLVEEITKRDKKRQRKIKEPGIDCECPEIVGSLQPVPKKIKFDED